MRFLKRSPTGHYDYWQSDIGLVLVNRLRQDYSPNQPRDSRGRFASGGGGGGGGGRGGRRGGGGGGLPLAQMKVKDLHEIAAKEGIDVNTLSHKSRRSVLAAAIEAKRTGKNLREEGLLKPTKRSGQTQPTSRKASSSSESKQSAAARAKIHSVKEESDFNDLVAHTIGKISKENGGLVEIHKVRQEIGELVPRDKFNSWLLKMQAEDKIQLTEGSVGRGGSMSQNNQNIKDAITTRVNGLRTQLKLTPEGEELQRNASSRARELDGLLKNRPELNPLGTASELAKGAKIEKQSDFNDVAIQAYDKLNKELNYGDIVPISDIRKSLGDRVSKEAFDKHLLDLQASDKIQLMGAQLAKGEKAPKELVEGGVTTRVSGTRVYVKKL